MTVPVVSPARAWTALVVLSLLYIVSFIDRLIPALLIEPIKADLVISDVQIGTLIGTSFAFVYSIAGLPIARLADTRNRKVLIFVGALVWGLSTAAAAFADSFAMLLVLRIGVALGEATLTPTAIALISDMFPPAKRALPISVFIMVGVSGGAGAMIVGAAVLQVVGGLGSSLPSLAGLGAWRLTLICVGLPAALLALLVPLLIPSVERRGHAAGQPVSVRGILAYHRLNRMTYIGFYGITGLISSINFSVLTWFPTHLIRSYGLSAASAGYTFGILGVGASVAGGLLLPLVSRRMIAKGRCDGPMTIALVICCVATPLLITSLLASNATVSIVALIVPLTLQQGLGILLAATAPLLAPATVRAQMVALYFLVLTLIGLGIGPTLVAAVAEHAAFADGRIGWALAAMILVFAPVQILLILKTRRAFAATYVAAHGRDETVPM